MHKPTIFYELPNIFSKDFLSEFLSSFVLIPKGFGHQYDNPLAECNDRIIGDFELIYIIGGQSNITIGSSEYNCFAGDIVIIPPFIKHKIHTLIDNPHNNYWIHFEINPMHLETNLLKALMPFSENKIHIGIIDELVLLYQHLELELNSKKPGNIIIFKAILTQILTILLRQNKDTQASSINKLQSNSSEVSIVNKSIDFIKENLYNQIRIEDICKYVNVSEPYIFKAFSRVIKMSPNHFIQQSKIKKAEQLLKSTDLSLKEISIMLNFKSQYYFSNVFKKFYEVSPKNYKQKFLE